MSRVTFILGFEEVGGCVSLCGSSKSQLRNLLVNPTVRIPNKQYIPMINLLLTAKKYIIYHGGLPAALNVRAGI